MKKLPVEVHRHGHVMRQIWRDRLTAIYRYPGGHEVIVIKQAPAQMIMGKPYPAREVYPNDDDWGVWSVTRPATDSLASLRERAASLLRDRLAKRSPEPRSSSDKGSRV
jgi:hypothetical protein